jgi:hypothetical protein
MATVLERFEHALASPAEHLSVHEVRAQMHLVRSVQAIAAARLIDLNRQMEALAGADEFVAVDPTRELRTHGGLRAREVRAVVTQAHAIDAAPALGQLLAAGATTAGHLEAMGRALDNAGEGRGTLLGQVDDIAHKAVTMRVDDFDRYVMRLARDAQVDDGLSQFERQRRLTHLRYRQAADGMLDVHARFDPEKAAVFINTVERRVEAMFHCGDRDITVDVAPGIDPNDHRRALALIALCTGPGSERDASDPRPARAELVVHVDLHTLQQGLHSQSVCRTQHGNDIPPATARRLACDAEIIPVVLGPPSVPLDVGRSRRLATVHQRRALETVHPTCAAPDCTVAFARCAIHHIVPWEHGGPTDLANLVPLCSRHHHAVHEGGWTLHLDAATRAVRITLPGRPVDHQHGDARHDDARHGDVNGLADLGPPGHAA